MGHERLFPSARFWTEPSGGLPFLFALHSFGSLAAYCAGPPSAQGDRFWTEVVASWLGACGKPARPAWHPYPLSRRLLAWSSALSGGVLHGDVEREALSSYALQARYLRRTPEHDIGGNHVLVNAAALVVAGACLDDGPTLRAGRRLLDRELARQILPDGAHEERSPAYHRDLLERLYDVRGTLDRTGHDVPGSVIETISRMEGWLDALTGPDGSLPLLNDAWEGPPRAGRSTDRSSDLAASGYVVLRSGEDQLVADIGRGCPSHLPAHVHADVGSFVLWTGGRQVVVDPGAYAYEGEARDRFRGTAAHATLTVDGRDQCDLWAPFRAAFLPRVSRSVLEWVDGACLFAVEHDGYRRLPDPVVHRRSFCWLPDVGVVVVDVIHAARAHRVRSALPLAPGLEPEGDLVAGLAVRPIATKVAVRVEHADYSPYLGTSVESRALVQEHEAVPGQVLGWSLLKPPARVVSADPRGLVVQTPDARLELEFPDTMAPWPESP